MFDYTQGAFHKVLDDFKKIARAVHIGSQIFSILYLIYALIASVGFFVLNVILLVLSVTYLVFFFVMEYGKSEKRTKKIVKETYQWSKRGIKFLVICLTAYALAFVSIEAKPLAVVFLLLMILGFVLDVLFYFIIKILTAEIELLAAGVKRDLEELKKPVQSVGNFFKRLSGKEIEPPPVLSAKEQRIQDLLEEQVLALQLRREEEKTDKKERKRQEREQEKQNKREQKKQAERLPAPIEEENV